MDGTPKTRPLSDEQMEGITGGLILPEAWSKIKEMAREKKHEGMNYKQFYNYLVKWRAETGMEGFCEGNLVRDFDSLADYAHEEWKYL